MRPKATSCRPSLLASHAATQRVPLPESSASLPSALNSRRKNRHWPCDRETRCHRRRRWYFARRASVRSSAWRRWASGSSIIRKSFPQAWALTKGIMLLLLCLSALCKELHLELRCCSRYPIRLIDSGTWLSARTQNRQFSQPLRMCSNSGGYRVSGNRDHVSGMLGRRGQRGLKAVVVAFVHRLPQRNPACCSAPTWSELYIRIVAPAGNSRR